MLYTVATSFFLFLSFVPFPGHSILVFFAFVPLFLGVKRKAVGVSHVWASGMIFWLLSLYWIPRTLNSYGNTGWLIAIAAYMALSIYLSLYFLVWGIVGRFLRWRLFLLAASFPLFEWLRYKLIYGFPFFMLSHAASDIPFLIQIAYPFTQWGTDLAIMLMNWVVVEGGWIRYTFLAAYLGMNAVLWFSYVPYDLNLRVALIQPDLSEKTKWAPDMREKNTSLVVEMVKKACEKGVDLIITPETTFPFYWGIDEETYRVLQELSQCRAHILLGVLTFRDKLYYNRAVLIRDGREVSYYDKKILVPFGEFIPFRHILGGILPISLPGDFGRGNSSPIFRIKGRRFICGICYEMAFPDHVLSHKGGFDFMVNITNDMWFGKTIAPYVHLWSSILRAVETRTYLLRCANSGISSIVDPRGQRMKTLGLFKRGILTN